MTSRPTPTFPPTPRPARRVTRAPIARRGAPHAAALLLVLTVGVALGCRNNAPASPANPPGAGNVAAARPADAASAPDNAPAQTRPAPAPAATLLLTNATIYTLDPSHPTAGALAIGGDRILAAGSLHDCRPFVVRGTTRIVDLQGAFIVPGLWDAHAHLVGEGRSIINVDLVGTRSFAEVVARVAKRAETTEPGAWILGRGWDQNDWPADEFGGDFPTHAALSARTPDHPVLLTRIDGHAVLGNARALARAGITRDTRAPTGGEIIHDAGGEPTGVLVDAATALIPTPALTAIQRAEALRAAVKRCLSLGLVGVHDAGLDRQTLDALEKLYKDEDLPFRVYGMLTAGSYPRVKERGPRVGLYAGRLTVRAVKYFIDGALGSRGAYLLAPYADRPATRGLLQLGGSAEAATRILAARTRDALERGFQVCTHAIGDGGNRIVLDAYERALSDRANALGTTPKALDARLRIEHAQVIALDDIPRFARLGVLPSMQPTHATSDMPWAEARVGPERIKGAYAWQRLRAAGVEHLPLGSDFPVEDVNPLWGIYAAVTRLTHAGTSPGGPGGWYPDQCLTRAEALEGFTRDACYAAFQEADGGRLAPGYWADLSVFDRDLMTVPPAELLKVRALATLVGGRLAFGTLGERTAPPLQRATPPAPAQPSSNAPD